MTGKYRLLDTASRYRNEEIVGEAIERAISEGHVRREDLFVITKLGMHEFHNPEAAIRL